MTSPVSICSNALISLGASPIADFNETGDRARMCANLYPSNRDALLRSHTWNCCIKRVALAADLTLPEYGFRGRYLLPGDWLRTVRLEGSSGWSAEYRQEGRYILTDGGASLRYVFRNENEGTWDTLLVEVMTALMAWRLSYPVTKSTSLRDSLGQEYARLLQQAKSIDSMEEPTDAFAEESPLISVRF